VECIVQICTHTYIYTHTHVRAEDLLPGLPRLGAGYKGADVDPPVENEGDLALLLVAEDVVLVGRII